MSNRYSQEELLEKLKQLADELGKSPSQHDVDQAEEYPSSQIYKQRFKTWTHAKKEAGLQTKDHGQHTYNRKELIEQLQGLADEVGREPEIPDLEAAEELPSFQTFVNRFGSWTEAKKSAGIDTEGPRPNRYSDEELLEYLCDLADALGRTPTVQDLRKADDAPSAWVYCSRLGSFPAAKQEAGLDPRDSPKYENSYSDDELLAALQALAGELGREPRQKDLEQRADYPGITTYQRRFDSWESAKELADVTD